MIFQYPKRFKGPKSGTPGCQPAYLLGKIARGLKNWGFFNNPLKMFNFRKITS